MSMWWFITTIAIIVFFSSPSYAYDNNPLQDICVAVNDSQASVFVNGKICKDPKFAKPEDFYASGLNVPAVPLLGVGVKIVDVNNMPGLNTLGISIARLDLEPLSLVPFHTHPRASELITVLNGTLYTGFLVPDPKNYFRSRLFSKILNPGDVFVYPKGLTHFQYNVGRRKATFLATFNSQNPGFIFIPTATFPSNPPIRADVLAKGFQLNMTELAELGNIFF